MTNILYEVSSHGRVRNAVTKKLLKLQKVKDKKYYRAFLRDGNGYKKVRIHRLVYQAFCGEIPENKEIDHIDENPSNNRLENLRCVYHIENIFNKSKSKTTLPMRVFSNGKSYGYKICVKNERIQKFGFKTPNEAFEESKKMRSMLSIKHKLFL